MHEAHEGRGRQGLLLDFIKGTFAKWTFGLLLGWKNQLHDFPI
jgi:hypothetical protein